MKKNVFTIVKKLNKTIYFALAAVIIALVWKMLFVSYTPDEEYQIVMSYRLATGGKLFYDVYDTIQTSAFVSAPLIRLFIAVTGGTTGVVIFLRFAGLLIKGLTAFYLYKVSGRYVKRGIALALSLTFFATFPKMIASPDFSSLQLDFTVLMICLLDSSIDSLKERKPVREFICIVLSALCLCGCILSTACFIMIPVVFVFLLALSKENRGKRSLIFWITCLITGCLYIISISYENGFSNLYATVTGILSGDMTHSSGANITGNSVLITYAKNTAAIAGFLAADALISYLICILLKKREAVFAVFLNFSFLVTLYYWFVKRSGYDGLKLFIPAIFLASLHYIVKNRKSTNPGTILSLFGIFAGLACFFNVLIISNVPLTNNLSFLFLSALFGMLEICMFEKEKTTAVFCTVFLAVTVLGSFFTVLSSPAGTTIFYYCERITSGPAKGCLVSDYMADVYNEALEDFIQNTSSKDNVLIVTNCWYNTNLTSLYMTNNVNISHYSVNSTPTYNAALLDYWQRFPEYYPDCIVINNSTGTTWEWDWITQYIQTYYDYDKEIDTKYLTFFVKEK